MRNVMILAAIQLRKFTFSVIMWFLEPYFKVLWEGVNLNFFIVFKRSAKKCFERSRIFRYGLPKDILSKMQKSKAGGAYPP